jgi:hypothetical protein
MDALWDDRWIEFYQRLLAWGTAVAVLVLVAAYVIGKIRAKPIQKEPASSQLMTKVRDLHSQGGLSDAEYRTIKTTLAARLQEELKDTGGTG